MSQIHTESGKESGTIEDHQLAPRRPDPLTTAGNGCTRGAASLRLIPSNNGFGNHSIYCSQGQYEQALPSDTIWLHLCMCKYMRMWLVQIG